MILSAIPYEFNEKENVTYWMTCALIYEDIIYEWSFVWLFQYFLIKPKMAYPQDERNFASANVQVAWEHISNLFKSQVYTWHSDSKKIEILNYLHITARYLNFYTGDLYLRLSLTRAHVRLSIVKTH